MADPIFFRVRGSQGAPPLYLLEDGSFSTEPGPPPRGLDAGPSLVVGRAMDIVAPHDELRAALSAERVSPGRTPTNGAPRPGAGRGAARRGPLGARGRRRHERIRARSAAAGGAGPLGRAHGALAPRGDGPPGSGFLARPRTRPPRSCSSSSKTSKATRRRRRSGPTPFRCSRCARRRSRPSKRRKPARSCAGSCARRRLTIPSSARGASRCARPSDFHEGELEVLVSKHDFREIEPPEDAPALLVRSLSRARGAFQEPRGGGGPALRARGAAGRREPRDGGPGLPRALHQPPRAARLVRHARRDGPRAPDPATRS